MNLSKAWVKEGDTSVSTLFPITNYDLRISGQSSTASLVLDASFNWETGPKGQDTLLSSIRGLFYNSICGLVTAAYIGGRQSWYELAIQQ